MFDHIGLFVSDLDETLRMYEACMEPLGIKIYQRQPQFGAVIFSEKADFPFLWLGTALEYGDYHGTPVKKDEKRPIHIALRAPSREAVMAFHRRGIENGGRCNGAPEDCGDGYFAAYLLDPDGNNIEAGIRTGAKQGGASNSG